MSDQPDTPAPKHNPLGETSLTLLQRLRANDPEAWRLMVHLYGPLVLQWCARVGVHGADADDISQEVFQAAARRLESFRRDREGDTFRGWLRVITRTRIAEHFRSRGREPTGQGGTDAYRKIEAIAAPVEDDDEAQVVDGLHRRALELVRAEFEERTWQMFWLTFVEDCSPVDVAADLGVTPAAVRKAKSRVLHRLREEVGDLIA